MKKFNAKKVIASGAVGVVLLGIGAGAAASDFWIGHSDVEDVQADLDTLDGLLTANETNISTLTTKVENLETTINELIDSLGLENGNYTDLQAKLDKIQEEAKTNKQFSKDAKILLLEIEKTAGIKAVPDENDVNARVAAIKVKALAYETDLKGQIATLKSEKSTLLTEKSELNSKLTDANQDLVEAASDVKELKKSSNEIVNKHINK